MEVWVAQLFPGTLSMKNVHPLFVHFPIAYWTGALFVEFLAVLYKEELHKVARWLLYLGTFSAVATLATGFVAESTLAQETGGHHTHSPSHTAIHTHRNWMVTSSIIGMLVSLHMFLIDRKRKWKRHRWGMLFEVTILVIMMALGADRGGRLVYTLGVGVARPPMEEERLPSVNDFQKRRDTHVN